MTNIILLLILFIAVGESIYTSEDITSEYPITIFKSVSEFKEKTQNVDDTLWLIQFYAPWCGHCKQFKPIFMDVAKGFKGIVNVGVVDVTQQGVGDALADEFNISGFPAIKIFSVDRLNPKTYDGQRTAPAIVQEVMNEMVAVISTRITGLSGGTRGPDAGNGQQQQRDTGAGDSKAVDLNAGNIQSLVYDSPDVWLVAFIAPWCGHCTKLKPEWKEAADQLAGQGVQLGLVDATVEESLGAEYGVRGFPTIKMFPGGAGKTSAMAKDYEFGRSASDIVREALAEVDRSGAPPSIPQLTSQKLFDDTCTAAGKSTVCVLIALPHILDSSADKRNANIEMLQGVTKSFRGTPFRFLWFEGTSQPKLESTMEMTFGFPAVVALNLDKSIYCIHRFSFNEKSLSTFLYSITSGRAASYKLEDTAQLSNILVDVSEWDGMDGEIEEEEFDLSDIMGDDWDTDL